MNRGRGRLVVYPLLVGALLLALVCGATGVAVKYGQLPPPEVELTVMGRGIIARTTNVPSCPIFFVPCGRIERLARGQLVYAVWVVWRPAERLGDAPGARRLFAMRLEP